MKMKCLTALGMALLLMCLFSAALAKTACVSVPNGQVNVRREGKSGAEIVCKLVSGARVDVQEGADGWAKITLGKGRGSITGYMMTEYLAAAPAKDDVREKTVASPYDTQSVVLRSAASDSYDAVSMAQVGQTVLLLGSMDGFGLVQLADGSVGWLSNAEMK